MGNRTRRLLAGLAAVAAAVLLFSSAPAGAIDAEILPVGSPAPDFTSEDVEGQPFALADALKKGPVMVVFWSLFCGTCLEELPIIQEMLPQIEGKVQVVTVNLDEGRRAANVKSVAKQKGFTFRMLLNKFEAKAADGTVTKREYQIDQAFKIKATPALYLINRDGTIAYGHYGALNPDELAGVVALAR